MARPSYRVLAGRVFGYTPTEGYSPYGYCVKGSNGARTVSTTMPRDRFLGMPQGQRDAWLKGARQWVQDQLT